MKRTVEIAVRLPADYLEQAARSFDGGPSSMNLFDKDALVAEASQVVFYAGDKEFYRADLPTGPKKD